MSINRFLLLLLFLPLFSLAQTTTISGKVTTSVSLTGIGKVSVFLSNSSFGTETADDGTFRLVGVKPGQYTLVASSVGFQQHTEQVLVGAEPIHLNIALKPKINQLRGVVITTEADFKRNLEIFKKQFIGEGENAKKCEIINPHVMNMIYHSRKLEMEAWSTDFLVIENKALGYRVKFLVDTFSSSGLSNITEWQGQVVFEELPGSPAQKQAWKLKREETYYGSARHFYRDLYRGTLAQDGFIMYRLHREINPKKFVALRQRDSALYWQEKGQMSRYYHERLFKEPLQPQEVFSNSDARGIFVLHFSDCLYVVYTRRREKTDFTDLYRPLDMENFETSVVSMHEPYALFDMNGVVFKGLPLNEGTWSKSRIDDLLPFDYDPGDEKEGK